MDIIYAIVATAFVVSCIFVIYMNFTKRAKDKNKTYIYIKKTPYSVDREVGDYIGHLCRQLNKQRRATVDKKLLDPSYSVYRWKLDTHGIKDAIAKAYSGPSSVVTNVELRHHPVTGEIYAFADAKLTFTRILVGVPSHRYADLEMYDCVSELCRIGIPILEVRRLHSTIRTPKCQITFTRADNYDELSGACCDACFYFDDTAKSRIRFHIDGDLYKGTFLDYVREIEGVKE